MKNNRILKKSLVAAIAATGLVGAHSAMTLMDAGHRLRLLVRNPDVASDYFGRRGVRARERSEAAGEHRHRPALRLDQVHLVEALVPPRSSLVGRTLRKSLASPGRSRAPRWARVPGHRCPIRVRRDRESSRQHLVGLELEEPSGEFEGALPAEDEDAEDERAAGERVRPVREVDRFEPDDATSPKR